MCTPLKPTSTTFEHIILHALHPPFFYMVETHVLCSAVHGFVSSGFTFCVGQVRLPVCVLLSFVRRLVLHAVPSRRTFTTVKHNPPYALHRTSHYMATICVLLSMSSVPRSPPSAWTDATSCLCCCQSCVMFRPRGKNSASSMAIASF